MTDNLRRGAGIVPMAVWHRYQFARFIVLLLTATMGVAPAAGEAVPDARAPGADGKLDPVADLQAIQNAFAALAKKVAPSVVTIKSMRTVRRRVVGGGGQAASRRGPRRRTYGAGSGVIVRADGMVLTNEHVIHEAEEIIIHLHDGREFLASIVQSDARSDLAVLRIGATGLGAAVLGDVADLRQGHMVFAMGNPFGVASEVGHASMSWGLVSALGRPLPLLGAAEDRYYGNLIETTASINPGNSGGPLFDIYGRVVGIMTAISTRTGRSDGVGFAVPISQRTRRIIARLMAGREIEYGLLGVVVHTPDADERSAAGVPRNRGALVDNVDSESPADKARLRPGDVIVKFDGQDVFGADHLVRMAGSTPPGHAVEIVFYREKKARTVRATLARRDRHGREDAVPIRWRGLTLTEITPEKRRDLDLRKNGAARLHGLIVVNVRPDSPAERAGFRRDMVLDRVGDHAVSTLGEFRHLIRRLRGQPVEITVYGGKRFELEPG